MALFKVAICDYCLTELDRVPVGSPFVTPMLMRATPNENSRDFKHFCDTQCVDDYDEVDKTAAEIAEEQRLEALLAEVLADEALDDEEGAWEGNPESSVPVGT